MIIACRYIGLSDFQRNQSEILIIPLNFSNLKNCNKLIAKNIAWESNPDFLHSVLSL